MVKRVKGLESEVGDYLVSGAKQVIWVDWGRGGWPSVSGGQFQGVEGGLFESVVLVGLACTEGGRTDGVGVRFCYVVVDLYVFLRKPKNPLLDYLRRTAWPQGMAEVEIKDFLRRSRSRR